MDDLIKTAVDTHAIIRAAEEWSHEYEKDPTTHSKLLKVEARWEIELKRMFKNLAAEAQRFLNYGVYQQKIMSDYTIDVTVNDDAFNNSDGQFISVSFEYVSELTAIGAAAGENIYGIKLGISSVDEIIQKLTMKQVAGLVGKRVLPDGTLIDNPNAKYNIVETMRNDIIQAIKTSVGLHESYQDAVNRISRIIGDPARAERIARTESVNAYQAGLREFAIRSGALGKQWQDVGAKDGCLQNSAVGPIPIAQGFPFGGVQAPTAHPHCRCGVRYIYAQEWNTLFPNGF